jgi:hypothetical protein
MTWEPQRRQERWVTPLGSSSSSSSMARKPRAGISSVDERLAVLVPPHLKEEDEIQEFLHDVRSNMLTLREGNRRNNVGDLLTRQLEAVVDGTVEAELEARERRKRREDLEEQLRVCAENDEEAEQRHLSGLSTLHETLRLTVARQAPKLAAFLSGAREGREIVAAANLAQRRRRAAANEAGRAADRLAADEIRSEAIKRKRDEDDRKQALNKRQLDNPIDVDTSFGADQGKHLSPSAVTRASKFIRLNQIANAETQPILPPSLRRGAPRHQRRNRNRKMNAFTNKKQPHN